MTRSLNEFRKQIAPEVQTKAREKALNIVAEMTLAEVRKHRGVKQVELAKRLRMAQPNISQIEARPDALLSTLEQYVAALGGELKLQAVFPDGDQMTIKRIG
ncbi:helix-turn-helix transcriptional regulator [Pseudidiomarina marina]|uniref:Transcriptional regulator n=1 Tax=Pseudidiomarina marina TaxID=502366 RepID=A0A432YDW8_9GAMM|nr:helix-turn-helix domain-containing protein [Pseudidiomarina marina]RUO59184.1 transcriptional regulator [Pseudidiomarina marina]